MTAAIYPRQFFVVEQGGECKRPSRPKHRAPDAADDYAPGGQLVYHPIQKVWGCLTDKFKVSLKPSSFEESHCISW